MDKYDSYLTPFKLFVGFHARGKIETILSYVNLVVLNFLLEKKIIPVNTLSCNTRRKWKVAKKRESTVNPLI